MHNCISEINPKAEGRRLRLMDSGALVKVSAAKGTYFVPAYDFEGTVYLFVAIYSSFF